MAKISKEYEKHLKEMQRKLDEIRSYYDSRWYSKFRAFLKLLWSKIVDIKWLYKD